MCEDDNVDRIRKGIFAEAIEMCPHSFCWGCFEEGQHCHYKGKA
jgi:hypothetical protein